jgi:hypothetical protein
MLQTIFGLTLPVTHFPIAPEQAQALAERIAAAAVELREGAPAAFAAGARRDAERYLGARRRRELHLPHALQRACDDGARDLMRLTVSTPPLPTRTERLVA